MSTHPAPMRPEAIQGAALKVGISNNLTSAALAGLAAVVALFSFVQQNFNPNPLFYALVAVSFGSLIFSLVKGGRGSNQTALSVARSAWSPNLSTPDFNHQALAAVVGVAMLLAAVPIGTLASAQRRPRDPCAAFAAQLLAASQPPPAVVDDALAACEAAR